MSLSKEKGESFLDKALKQYANALRKYPILTKSCTSGFTAGLGNLLSQTLVMKGQPFNVRNFTSFAILGFCFIGPAMHFAYKFLERAVPQKLPYFAIRRLLLERLFITPVLTLAYLYFLYLLQLRDPKIAALQLMVTYKQVLVTNWKVWTIFQFINVNYIPQNYRVLFGNAVSLGWNVYMATRSAVTE